MYTVKTQISFEAAHRLYDVNTYSAECRENLHGHSYKVNVEVTSGESTNSAGMVVDFKLLKNALKEVEDQYDHSCILKANDPLCEPIKANCKKVFRVMENPTAEWMAKHLFNEIFCALRRNNIYDVELYKVEVQETENNIACYIREEGNK